MRQIFLTNNKIPVLKNSPQESRSFRIWKCLHSLAINEKRCRRDSSDQLSFQPHVSFKIRRGVEIKNKLCFARLHLSVVLSAVELCIRHFGFIFLPPCTHLKWFPLETSVTPRVTALSQVVWEFSLR